MQHGGKRKNTLNTGLEILSLCFVVFDEGERIIVSKSILLKTQYSSQKISRFSIFP